LKPANLLYAFSVRRIIVSYTGPVLKLRRSSDNTESDFYSDSIQSYLTTGAGNTGTTFSSWVGAGTAYVTKWYDQSGKNCHATASSTTAEIPTISIQNSKYVVYFNNTASNRNYLILASAQSPSTMFSHFYHTDTSAGIATIFCKALGATAPADYGQRFVNLNTTHNPWPITYPTNGDWYNSLTGTKNAYVNGASAITINNTWTSIALTGTALSTDTTRQTLQYLGTDGYSTDYARGMKGYMTEMLGHNSTYAGLAQATIQSDLVAFYTNRLF
jgi:hypothetical protein